MDINAVDGTSCIIQYHEAFLNYVVNEYCAEHQCVPLNKHESLPSSNPLPSPTASGSRQSSIDLYDLSSNEEEYLTRNNVAETTPGRSDRAALILTVARLYLNSPPKAPKNWGQINPNLNNYHSNAMEICSIFWISDITDWWCHQEEMHSKYTDLSNVARDIFSIIPYGVGVEASFSLARDVIGWRQSKTTGETIREKVVVRQFPWANDGILVGNNPVSDTTNTETDLAMKKEAEERKLRRMAKVHNFLKMWQGSQNLCAAPKNSHTQNNQMTAVGYISDTEKIVKAYWSLFRHAAAAAFKLSKRFHLPPALSVKDLLRGRTQILNVCRIWRFICHPVEIDEDSAPESILDTEDWLIWNGDLENPNDREDDCAADNESDTKHNNVIEDPECPEQQNLSGAPNVPRLVRPTRKSRRQGEKVLVMVNAIDNRRNIGVKKTLHRMHQWFTSIFM